MTAGAPKRKIAILGGGPSGLSAAFHLTSQEGWQDRYEVTIYQMGWRLGGKCATGRDPVNKRIQEHGIHLFGGFYTNTFAMVREAYHELYGADASQHAHEPIRTLDDAFVPNTYLLFTEQYRGKVYRHDLWPPDANERPWDRGVQLTMAAFLTELLDALLTTLTNHHVGVSRKEISFLRRIVALPLLQRLATRFQKFSDQLMSGKRDADEVADRWARTMQRAVRLMLPLTRVSSSLRWKVMQLDLIAALLRGVIDDRLLEGNLDAIDGLTDRDWLARNGATRLVLDSTLPQMVSNICFEYDDGDSTHGPRMSARAFVSFQLRGLIGRGRAMYYFRAGTGETVISPVYRVLRERGVRFEFFHKVTGIGLSDDGTNVEEVRFDRQATPTTPGGYEPTFLHGGLYCWPDRPDWNQLAEGHQLRTLDEAEAAAGREGLDLESWWCPWTGTADRLVRGHDFDEVVLAIPVGALPHIAGEVIAAHPAVWEPMLAHVTTTPTQHVQVWLDRPLHELGWKRPMRFGSATWTLPFTDVVDLTDLLPYEDWQGPNPPQALLYFCGPMQEDDKTPPFTDTSYPHLAREKVSATAASWLRGLHELLPDVVGNRFDIDSFDFDLLHVPAGVEGVYGENRMRYQFIKVNIDPNERYVLSLPGSNKYRLSAWGSGIDNLVLCGDWIDTGLNVGSFEAAVTSGALACYALTGTPEPTALDGYSFLRTDPPLPQPGLLWAQPGTKR